MSKIGKKTLLIPEGVDVTIADSLVKVKGPKGELSSPISNLVEISIQDRVIKISPRGQREDKITLATWGLTRALIQNMVIGVTEGFTKVLEFQGVGYKASIKGNDLELGLGFSHPVMMAAPKGIIFKTEKNMIQVSGIDKDLVGRVAAQIRSYRKPEPYKGSGIRYQGEVIKKKIGKKAAATA